MARKRPTQTSLLSVDAMIVAAIVFKYGTEEDAIVNGAREEGYNPTTAEHLLHVHTQHLANTEYLKRAGLSR
jgi:hypothetical protein